MIRYFSKIALRYLWHNKSYTGLNYICLSFGFTCAIIATLYIVNMLDYDKFNLHYHRLYSVESLVTYFNGDRFPKEYLSSSLPDVLQKNAPEIEKVARVAEYQLVFTKGENEIPAGGIYADASFFDLFTFPLLRGQSAGNEINSILISEQIAMSLFENIDCTGKTLSVKDGQHEELYRVSGIFKKIPSQSSLQFDFIIPFTKFLAANPWAYETGATANMTWILLNSESNTQAVNEKIKNLIKTQEENLNQELFLFPLKDKALYRYADGKKVWGQMQYVVIAGTVGFIILLIACFNFINLAIAKNIRRYRETGIKKVVGSRKSIIMYQFLGETFVIIFFSFLTAIFLVNLLLPLVNAILNSEIHLPLFSLKIILLFLSIALFTGIAGGLAPALYLASATPLQTLKGKNAARFSYNLPRQTMIIFQFTIPIALIICMMIIRTQDRYMRNYNVGVDKDKVIVIDNTEAVQKHAQGIRADISKIPGIAGVSFTNCLPSRGTQVLNDVEWNGMDHTVKLHFWCINTDFDYNKVVDLKLTDGRFFDPSFPADSGCYLINDLAADIMKKNDPVGSELTVEGKKGTIIGVFKDFHAIDLAGPLTPVIIRLSADRQPFLLVRYASGDFLSTIGAIQQVYSRYDPETPLQAALFRDLRSYSNLNLPSNLMGISFIVALLLACMGLFGLASFTSESRTKEIGIRKTNGATTASIMVMLLQNYFKWLVIAFLIAAPLSWFLGSLFLSRFHFHTTFPFWVFAAGPLIAFTVAILTVSSQTWKVANRNPVVSLRYE